MKSTRLERLATAIASGTIAHGMARVINNSDEFAKEVMARALALERKLNEEERSRVPRSKTTTGQAHVVGPWQSHGTLYVREHVDIEGNKGAAFVSVDLVKRGWNWSAHGRELSDKLGHDFCQKQEDAMAAADATLRDAGYELKN